MGHTGGEAMAVRIMNCTAIELNTANRHRFSPLFPKTELSSRAERGIPYIIQHTALVNCHPTFISAGRRIPIEKR